MATIAEMVCGGFVRISSGAVLVGPCSCECPPACPISIDALWQSWKGDGNWVDVGEGSIPSPGVVYPVRVFRSGGIGADAGLNYCGLHPSPAWIWSPEESATITLDGLSPSGYGSLEVVAYDAFGRRVFSGHAHNSVGAPGTAPYTGGVPFITVDVNMLDLSAACANSSPWCGCPSGPLDGERHRGCLRFVWVCVNGGVVQSIEVLGGEVADPLEKIAPFLDGDGQYFFAVEFYGLRIGNTPGGRTYISRDDDWVIHRWMNPPV